MTDLPLTDDRRTPLPPATSIWRMRWGRFRRHRLAMISLVFLAVLAMACASAYPIGLLLDVDATATNLLYRYEPPSAEHLLGTDELGRDVLLRLLYGGQVSIAVGLLASIFTAIIGIAVGITAGFAGGRIDGFLMRFTDCVIALPMIPVLIVLGAVDMTKLGFSPATVSSPLFVFFRIVIIIALVDWTTIARIARAGALSVRGHDYVRAATVSGARKVYNATVHVLPNIATPLIVATTLAVGRIILFESTLSFLGFGIVPPTPTWGNMLTNAQQLIVSAPALAIYPGLLIFLTVMAVNFVGDGVRFAFDPRSENEFRSA